MSATGPLVDCFCNHFIERWNFAKRELYFADTLLKPLGPRFDIASPKQYPTGPFSAHLCRSACEWSQGVEATEKSIQNAYIHLIENAERNDFLLHI